MRPKEGTVAKYKVKIGIDTPSGRHEPDAVIDHTSVPSKSLKWLVEQGILELVGKEPEPVIEADEEEEV